MSKGVLFFNAGSRHGIHLIVSLMSLRDHYDGPVAIVCEEDGPGRDVAEWCARDAAMGDVRVIPDRQMVGGGKGASYFCKTLLPRLSPFDATIFIDADTLVVGDISPLWPDQATGEVVLTRFADWVTTGGKMKQRILGWKEVEPDRVARMLERPWPAVNTGVMAWSRNSEAFCEDWTHTGAKRRVFIGDEIAAQIIYPDHVYRMMDDRFNASCVFPSKGETVLDKEDVRIRHFHGGKAWKRPQGFTLYKPYYLRALEANRANIQSLRLNAKWWSKIPAADQQELSRYFAKEEAVVK